METEPERVRPPSPLGLEGIEELIGCDGAISDALAASGLEADELTPLAFTREGVTFDGGGKAPPDRYEGQRERSSGREEVVSKWESIAAACTRRISTLTHVHHHTIATGTDTHVKGAYEGEKKQLDAEINRAPVRTKIESLLSF